MRAGLASLGLLLLVTYSAPLAAGEAAPAGRPSAKAAAQPQPTGGGSADPESAGAAGPDAQAAEHYLAGVRALEARRHAEAYAHLSEAWRLKQHFQIAANLGAVEMKLGKRRDAAEHLAYFLREAKGVPPAETRRAEKMLAEARQHVGALDIEVEPSGAEVFVVVEGQPAAKAPLQGEIFVDPGRHTVEVRLAGFGTVRAVIEATAGASLPVHVALQPEGQELAKAAAPAPRRVSATAIDGRAAAAGPVYWPAIAAAGVALGGLGVGVGFTVAANGRAEEAGEELERAAAATPSGQIVCPIGGPSSPACARIAALLAEKDRFSNAAVAGYVVGGIAAVAAAGFSIWPPGRAGRGLEARVAPNVSLEGGGLLVKGTF